MSATREERKLGGSKKNSQAAKRKGPTGGKANRFQKGRTLISPRIMNRKGGEERKWGGTKYNITVV